jgi:hypothetical protein
MKEWNVGMMDFVIWTLVPMVIGMDFAILYFVTENLSLRINRERQNFSITT